MSKTLDQLKTTFNLLLKDPSGGIIDDGQQEELLNLAIRELQGTADVYGTIFESDLDLFNGEFEYPAPANFKATIDLLDRDNSVFRFMETSEKEFWRRKDIATNFYADANRRDTRFLLVNSGSDGGGTQINNMDSLTANGTWAAVGGTGVSNLAVDTVVKREGEASISYDITAATVPALENSTMAQVDLSSHENKSTLFLWVYLPTVTSLSNVILRWGSSTTDFWAVTETDQFSEFPFQTGWNRLGFKWDGAAETGTPVSSAVDYIRVTITYSVATTDTDFRIDALDSKLPTAVTHSFYTIPMVKDASGDFQDEFSTSTDVTVMDNRHDELLVYKALEFGFMINENAGQAQMYRQLYDTKLQQMTSDNNSLRARPTDSYYLFSKSRFRNRIHRTRR